MVGGIRSRRLRIGLDFTTLAPLGVKGLLSTAIMLNMNYQMWDVDTPWATFR